MVSDTSWEYPNPDSFLRNGNEVRMFFFTLLSIHIHDMGQIKPKKFCQKELR